MGSRVEYMTSCASVNGHFCALHDTAKARGRYNDHECAHAYSERDGPVRKTCRTSADTFQTQRITVYLFYLFLFIFNAFTPPMLFINIYMKYTRYTA